MPCGAVYDRVIGSDLLSDENNMLEGERKRERKRGRKSERERERELKKTGLPAPSYIRHTAGRRDWRVVR